MATSRTWHLYLLTLNKFDLFKIAFNDHDSVKRSRFAYTPESTSSTNQKGSFVYFIVFFLCFYVSLKDQFPNKILLSFQGNLCFFARYITWLSLYALTMSPCLVNYNSFLSLTILVCWLSRKFREWNVTFQLPLFCRWVQLQIITSYTLFMHISESLRVHAH